MNLITIPPGLETESFVLEADALRHAPEILRKHWGAGPDAWIVADENTWTAAGEKLNAIFEEAGIGRCAPYLFPGRPILHATVEHVDELLAAFPENCVPVAVGGGTVNDLVKRASGVKGVRYCCVPTAPSVDGYTSYGAALNVDGLKKTLPCPAPLAIVADTAVLDSAPPEMFAAGYADLMAKIPAGADWIVVDQLGMEPVRPDVWELVQTPLRDNLSDPADVRRVFLGLAATGYSMQLYRDSRPASGAEHLMSHIWEMENLTFNGDSVSHGFKVSVGTVASTALYEALFSLTEKEARRHAEPGLPRAAREAEIDALLIRGCYGAEAKEIALSKFLEGEKLAERRELIYRNWDALKERTQKQLYPLAELKAMLKAAHCPASPAEIGLESGQYVHGVAAAQLIRKRYTILDLVYELGLSKALLAAL